MIFFIASDDMLHMVYKGVTGNNVRVILSQSLAIEATVTNFAISQDLTSTIYLVFATTSSVKGSKALSIVRPIKPDEIDWQASDLSHLLLPGDDQNLAIDKILLVSSPT